MKALTVISFLMCSAIFFAVFGAFFDLITSKEAVMVLVACGLPLTALSKITN